MRVQQRPQELNDPLQRMKGPDVAKLVSVTHPKVKVIYMSGYTERALHVESCAEPSAVYLEKPLRLVTLAQKISEILSPQDQQEAKPPA